MYFVPKEGEGGEKERTEITKNIYLHALMKNQIDIGREERRRRKKKNVRI